MCYHPIHYAVGQARHGFVLFQSHSYIRCTHV